MLIDTQNVFSWEQAITVDAISTNVIDLLSASGAINAGDTGGPSANTVRDIGAGEPLYLHILVTTTMAKAGANPTLTVTLESDDNTSLTTATVHMTVATAVAEATLVAGYWIAKGVAIPAGAYERYLGIRYTTNTDDFDTGKVSAWLSNNRYDDRTYESGWNTGIN